MMREPVDLRRAIKEEVGREQADLTFTPAMQERVLAEIKKRPRSRLAWLYPASAAAAVLLILVTSRTHLAQREQPQHEVAAPPTAATPVQEQTGTAPAERVLTSEAQVKTVVPSEPVPSEPMKAQPKDAPPHEGIASNKGMAVQDKGKLSMLTVAPVTGPQLAAVPAQHLVVTLTDGSITRVDPAGAPVWQVALPASKQAQQVVAAPNGKLVVGAEGTVLLLGADGSMLESLQVAEPVRLIAAGPGDRLALVSEQAVYLRQAASQPLVALAEKDVSAASFTPDGVLLLATPRGLIAYGPDGQRRWVAGGDGGPLLVSPDGKAILWGNNLYDAEGVQLVILEPTAGVVAGGPGLLRWEGDQLKGFTWAAKRSWTWTAPGFITSVIPGEGDRLWVVMDTPEGVKLQGIQGSLGRPVGKAQALPASPQEAVAVDGYLYLRLPEGLTILPM
jgi:hypothetical protein